MTLCTVESSSVFFIPSQQVVVDAVRSLPKPLSLRMNKSNSQPLISAYSANGRTGAVNQLYLIHQQPPPVSGALLAQI